MTTRHSVGAEAAAAQAARREADTKSCIRRLVFGAFGLFWVGVILLLAS